MQDLINQYTALWQGCDPKVAKEWIVDEQMLHGFEKSYNAFGQFMNALRQMPECQKLQDKLLLNNIGDHRPRLNTPANTSQEAVKNGLAQFKRESVAVAKGRATTISLKNPIFANSGMGFSNTIKRSKSAQNVEIKGLNGSNISDSQLKTGRDVELKTSFLDKVKRDIVDNSTKYERSH